MAMNVAEGQSYGIVTAGSTVTLKNLNVHSFPVDSVVLGLNVVDTNDVMTNVFVHDSGRQGLTVGECKRTGGNELRVRNDRRRIHRSIRRTPAGGLPRC